MPMKIMLPVDGSPTALQAVEHALALVRAGLQAEFVLANVQPPTTLYEMVTARDAEMLEDVTHGAGEHLLEGAARLLDQAGVTYVREVATGEPASMLIDLIEEHGCDMVVIGASSVGDLRSVLVGSVPSSLLHDAPVPVTVVHRLPAAAEPDDDTGEPDAQADAEADGEPAANLPQAG